MPYPTRITPERLAESAVAIAVADGLPALGVRPVAERLGVRPSALYRHCGDALGLVALVAEAGAERLAAEGRAAIERADPTGRNAVAALRAFAEAYRRFAEAEPALHAAVHTDTSGSLWPAQPGGARKALWTLLLATVGRVTQDPDDTGAAVAVWSFLHGYAALGAAGMFGASGPQGGFERGLTALIEGLARGATRGR